MVVYGVTLGFMMIFLLLVAVMGAAGTVVRRGLKKSPVPLASLMRALGSRQGVTFSACAVVVAMHVERLSLQPTFRTPTLQGEILFWVARARVRPFFIMQPVNGAWVVLPRCLSCVFFLKAKKTNRAVSDSNYGELAGGPAHSLCFCGRFVLFGGRVELYLCT